MAFEKDATKAAPLNMTLIEVRFHLINNCY
jgi:hypothetical protein